MPSSLADLLAHSRRFHQQAKVARQQGRIDDAFVGIASAKDLRLTAHDLDPEHLDQAWSVDRQQKFDHDAILVFYRDELAKDQDSLRAKAKPRLTLGQRVVAESLSRAPS